MDNLLDTENGQSTGYKVIMANLLCDILVVQPNINGCSKHSISAPNNYINTNEAKIIVLSETKISDLTDNDFQNYRVILKPNLENLTLKSKLQS